MKTTYHLKITGRVQGVWYRAWTRENASELGLDGWVRNCMDGSVEALVQGEDSKVKELIERCHTGPSAARVDDVAITPSTEPVAPGFRQERTV